MSKNNKSSIVSINFSSKIEPQSILFMGAYSMPYPDSLGRAIHDGEHELNTMYGSLLWKPIQWAGINIDGEIKKTPPKMKSTQIVEINKNDLMLQIIRDKDRKKLKKYQDIFTQEELKLLREKLGYKRP